MKPAFWFILLLVASSGFSAYIGNEWGRKIGKRKLSVFQLRPKHSSTFLTILLSMAISLSGLGAIVVFLPDFRQALLNPRNDDNLQAYQTSLQQSQATIRKLSALQKATLQITSVSQNHPPTTEPLMPTKPEPLKQTNQALTSEETTPSNPIQVAQNTEARPAKPEQPYHQTKPVLKSSKTAAVSIPADQPLRKPQARTSIHLARAQSSHKEEQASSEQAVLFSDKPIFALRILGDLKPADGSQILDGIILLAGQYANLSSHADASPAIQVQGEDLARAQKQLSHPGQYEIAVHVAAAQPTQGPMPIKFNISTISQVNYDPHLALESQRLEMGNTQNMLKADLRTALYKLRQDREPQNQSQFTPEALNKIQVAQLPFELFNLRQDGLTLKGQLVLGPRP